MPASVEFIASAARFDELVSDLGSVFRLSCRLPEQVFEEGFGGFGFFEFDDVMSERFWLTLVELSRRSSGAEIIMFVVEPDAKDYFRSHFGYYGAAQLPVDLDPRGYVELLELAPSGSPADAVCHNSRAMVFCSTSHEWGIWADRELGVGILASRGVVLIPTRDAELKRLRWFSLADALQDLMALAFEDQLVSPAIESRMTACYGLQEAPEA